MDAIEKLKILNNRGKAKSIVQRIEAGEAVLVSTEEIHSICKAFVDFFDYAVEVTKEQEEAAKQG